MGSRGEARDVRDLNRAGELSTILRKKPLTEQEQLVLRLPAQGKSWLEIGERVGVSEHRVKQIRSNTRARLKEYEENPKDGMALRPSLVKKSLGWMGYSRRSQVLADIESGKLW